MNRQQRVVLLFGLLLISVAMLGCANSERVAAPGYAQDLERARASIATAERAGAEQYGSAQLSLARDKLRAAENALDDGETERAQQLAVEADLDANLAAAITRNRETQALANEVQSTLETLDEELRRPGGANTDRP